MNLRTRTGRVIVSAALIVLAVALAVAIDYATHAVSARFAVPGYYFRNKLLFGSLWAWIGFILFRHMRSTGRRTASVAALVSVLLQLRYWYEGYPLWFVFLFMGLHFLMFWAAFLVVERLSRSGI